MTQDFTFNWNGRRWAGYFNVIDRETVIAHFEDANIREAVGQTLAYSKTESGAIAYAMNADVQQSHSGIYEAIQKGVESRLGKSLQYYLN